MSTRTNQHQVPLLIHQLVVDKVPMCQQIPGSFCPSAYGKLLENFAVGAAACAAACFAAAVQLHARTQQHDATGPGSAFDNHEKYHRLDK